MKKSILIIIAVMAFQSSHAGETFVGPKIGFIFSHATSRDAVRKSHLQSDRKLHIGPTGGLNIFTRFNNYVGLQFELNARTIGHKQQINSDNYSETRFIQVETPILIKAGYGKESYFVYISTGPYVAVNAGAHVINKIAGVKNKEKLDFDNHLVNGVKRVDVGISAGIGGMYIMKKGALDIEFRYNVGLMGQRKDIDPKKANDFWTSFGLNLAYVFRTKS